MGSLSISTGFTAYLGSQGEVQSPELPQYDIIGELATIGSNA